MPLLEEIRRRSRHLVGPFLGVCMVVYFGYHTVHGDRGLLAWWKLRHDLREAESLLARMSLTRHELERRTTLLRPDSLDPDLVEERARAMLDVLHEDELLILTPTR